MAKMKGARALIESLKQENVDTIFGIPGGAMIDVYDELYDSDIRHILTKHEQVAAHAAAGYARASGKIGVCFATSGPGATNLTTGIADAFADSTPVLAVTGQVATSAIGNDAFQEADTVGIFMPITKYNFQIQNAKDIAKTVKEAIYIAQTGRPGPVHIDFPKDLQQAEIDFKYPKKIELETYKPKTKGHPKQIKKAVKMILDSKRPVLLVGGGVTISNAMDELFEFAQMLKIPVASTLMGKGCFPETHPLSLGVLGMHGKKIANDFITDSDCIITVGVRFSDRITGNIDTFAPEAKFIQIDIDPAEIGKNVQVRLPIVGDAKKVLSKLIHEIKSTKFTKKYDEELEDIIRLCECDFDFQDCPIKPPKVIHELQKLIDDKTIVTTEVGQCQMWAEHYLKITHPRRFITSGGLGTMGFGFPAAIGAKVAKPDHKVVDIAGDGSFTMNCQDLATCVKDDIPVTVIVLNNKTLGMVYQWQKLFYNKRFASTEFGYIADFVKLAEAFGAEGIRVEKPSEISDALKQGLNNDVATVIDVVVDPNEDILPMVPAGGSINQMIRSPNCKWSMQRLKEKYGGN